MNVFKQILFIRVGALGDLLVSLEALKLTIDRFPNDKIWVMGPSLWLELLTPTDWPMVNGVIVINERRGTLFEADAQNNWIKMHDSKPLKFFYKKVSATVNLRIESFRYAIGPWLSRVPQRIGSSSKFARCLYTDSFRWLGKEPQIHERDWY